MGKVFYDLKVFYDFLCYKVPIMGLWFVGLKED
jgi:hypothetical protein